MQNSDKDPTTTSKIWPDLLHYGLQTKRKKKNTRSKSMFEWVYGSKTDHQCIEIPDDIVEHEYYPLGSMISSSMSITSTITTENQCHVQTFLVKFAKSSCCHWRTIASSGTLCTPIDGETQPQSPSWLYSRISYRFLWRSRYTTESLGSAAQLVTICAGLDLDRFCKIYRLFESVLCDEMSVKEATKALDHITQGPHLYPWWLTWIGYGLASSASMPLFFNGGAVDMAFGFWWGVIIAGGVVHLSSKVTRFASIFDVVMSSLVGFLSAVVASRLSVTCFYALSLGGVVSLLPGYATLISVLEIASGAVASGTLKLTTTLIYSLLIGFGLAIGASAHQLIFPSLALVSSDEVCERNLSQFFDILLVPLFAAGQLILLRARWQKYPIMLMLAVLSHMLHRLCMSHFVVYPHVGTVLASLAVAVASNLYARLTPTVGFVDMMMGLLFLVPGSVGVSSTLDTFGQALATTNPMTEMSIILNAGQQGLIFSSHMLVIAVSVSVGLVLAAALLFPVRKLLDCKRKKSPYHSRDWVGEITF